MVNSSYPASVNQNPVALPRVAITMGDPAGIGPEVVLKAINEDAVRRVCQPVVVGDAQTLLNTAQQLNLDSDYKVIRVSESFPAHNSTNKSIPLIYDLGNIKEEIKLGIESAICGRASAEYIEASVELCTKGITEAVTTAPINKRSLFLAGYSYPGHTEFYAGLTNTEDYAMAFAAGNLRIVLLSTHVPLSKALGLVVKDRIVHIVKLADRELKRWGVREPHIAMAALNPHGAEGGLFGEEESAEILPAVRECQEAYGIKVIGPFSADTVFLRASRGEFDAVIACYHDQAMIPIKCLSFGEAVNITMGLPFIRTSVDHGTAFDIAGKGVAEHSSMVEAIKMAAQLARAQLV
jgi:4-phospho-D-threonate 3-dehydrogenase / 4-phospho-D-erythronate 3-dehydrogenase